MRGQGLPDNRSGLKPFRLRDDGECVVQVVVVGHRVREALKSVQHSGGGGDKIGVGFNISAMLRLDLRCVQAANSSSQAIVADTTNIVNSGVDFLGCPRAGGIVHSLPPIAFSMTGAILARIHSGDSPAFE